MLIRSIALIVLCGLSWTAIADDDNQTLDAAIGGGVGGAAGGAIGAELGGREGAVIGAGLGAAVGAAISTRDHTTSEPQHRPPSSRSTGSSAYYLPTPKGTFCPPGQAKKGRC